MLSASSAIGRAYNAISSVEQCSHTTLSILGFFLSVQKLFLVLEIIVMLCSLQHNGST
jgi:hypothetical protein